MAHRLCLSHWLLVCWLVATVVEGRRDVVVPPRGSQNNVAPTNCQIFTLTPPPTTRKPVTRIQPITRAPRNPFQFFPPRWPGFPIGFPNRPFLPPKCNHRFHFRPFVWPHSHFTPHYFPRRFRRGSSSEESRWKREAPNMLKQKKPMPQKRL